jgi:hypothetical protein
MNQQVMAVLAGYIDASVELAVGRALAASEQRLTGTLSASMAERLAGLEGAVAALREAPPPCATCGDVGLLPERAMGDPQGQIPCPHCPAGTAMAAQIAASARYMEAYVDKAVTQAVAEIDREALRGPPGNDGKDGAPGERGEVGPAGERGEAGEKGLDGQHGIDGKDGANGLDGKDGADGRSIKGDPGEKGIDGKDGRDGLHGKDGKDGRDGKDGITVDQLKAGLEDTLTTSLPDAVSRTVDEALARVPLLVWKDVWQAGKSYVPGNVVTFGGGMWHCNQLTSDKPETSDAWSLCVKKGRDFRPPDRK